jgi:gluconolactonase
MIVAMSTPKNPLKGWRVEPEQIRTLGQALQRPECVLAERDGSVWAADARGVMRIDPSGDQTLIRQQNQMDRELDARSLMLGGSLPNGIAFDRNGDIVIANFGTDAIELMTRDGVSRKMFDSIDGVPLGKTNFVLVDSKGRIWFTVTTRLQPWTRSINEKAPDGYVGLIDETGIRVVAEGFVGTNEIRFDAAEEWLYVVESNARRISRLRVAPDGSCSDREIYGPSDLGGIPDGFAFDAYGNLWVTLIISERLIAITPDGELLTLLDDGNPAAIKIFDQHFYAGTMTPEIMATCKGTIAPLMASLTFGGTDLCTVYLGSLMGTTLPYFRSPVPGLPLAHWNASRRGFAR